MNNFCKLLPLLLFSLVVHAAPQQIEAAILLQRLAEQPPVILDVRSQQEYQQGHIEGAINIPYDQLAANSRLIAGYRQQEVILYCRSGRRAQHAYQTLLQKGFTQLVMLQGHMNLWQQRQYPLVSAN